MPDETICGYAVHPACAMLPMMSEASLAELAEDIKANGQEQPVVVHRGLLLDGRNRLQACALAGVSPMIREWEGEDPVRWVLSLNFHRRHLTDSQKSIVGARAEEFLAQRVREHAQAQLHEPEIEPVPVVTEDEPKVETLAEASTKELSRREVRRQARESVAALVNVSPQAIARGRKLIEKAVPELVGAVSRGTVSLSQASRVAELDSEQQRDLAARGDAAIVEEAARIQKDRASARPSTTKALGDLDRLCSELVIQKGEDGEWSIEGRLHESDEAVSERGATLKEAVTSAWARVQGVGGDE